MNEMHNYSINKQRAIAEMLDMSKRATKAHNSRIIPNINVPPFLQLPFDSDVLIILALMLVLYNDSVDMLLIFALAYILI